MASFKRLKNSHSYLCYAHMWNVNRIHILFHFPHSLLYSWNNGMSFNVILYSIISLIMDHRYYHTVLSVWFRALFPISIDNPSGNDCSLWFEKPPHISTPLSISLYLKQLRAQKISPVTYHSPIFGLNFHFISSAMFGSVFHQLFYHEKE